jgi:hypothetical protein
VAVVLVAGNAPVPEPTGYRVPLGLVKRVSRVEVVNRESRPGLAGTA